MKAIQRYEKGQMLVILTVGIVVLLGFAGLAIDVGQYYSDRRHDQNAADDAALAGASAAGNLMSEDGISIYNFSCSNLSVQEAMVVAGEAAQARALENGFSISIYDEANPQTTNVVQVTCPTTGTYLNVDVNITGDTSTTFAQLVFDNYLRNSVNALTLIEPGSGLGEGMAIVALEKSENCGTGQYGGLFFGGSGNDNKFGTTDDDIAKITINGSGAHSNSCMECMGASVTVDSDGPIEMVTGIGDTNCKEGSIMGPGSLTNATNYIESHPITVQCGTETYQNTVRVNNNGSSTIGPGNYKGIVVNGGGVLVLEPGLYCLSGPLDVSGSITVASTDPYNDDGVTLYVQDSVTINGSGTVNLRAPVSDWGTHAKPASLDYPRPTIAGLLLYVANAKANTVVTLNGNADTIFRGTIYYPTGDIKLVGNSSNANWLVSVIGNKVTISGNADVNITYNGDLVHAGYPYLSLEK